MLKKLHTQIRFIRPAMSHHPSPSRFNLSLPLAAVLLFTTAPGFAETLDAPKAIQELKDREAKVQSLVQKVRPAVVCITTKGSGGTGSGVIVSKDGLVLTAGHVTQATGKDLDIILPDGTHVKGKALGANYGTDAGLAKITDAGDYPFAEIGDSNKLKLGDWVVAMGHPEGFYIDRKPPVRLGRVWGRDAEGAILSDCTLIGGDSGGPLFDLAGKVIGINSSINADREYNRHVAVDTIVGDIDDMKAEKTWGRLRMTANDLKRPRLGLMLNSEVTEGGCPVSEVPEGSAAGAAGVKMGDIIEKFDGVNIPNYWALMRELSDRKAGDKIKMGLRRGNEVVEIEVELQGRETAKKRVAETPREPKKNHPAEPKIDQPTGPRPYFGAGLDGQAKEATIESVSPGSPAEKGGLKPGDVIKSVDGKDVPDPGALAEQISKHKPGDKIAIKAKRGSEDIAADITLDKK